MSCLALCPWQPSAARFCWSVWLFLNHRFRRVDRFIFGFVQIVVWYCLDVFIEQHPSEFMRVYIDSHHPAQLLLRQVLVIIVPIYRTTVKVRFPGWFAASPTTEPKAPCFVYRCHNCECVCSIHEDSVSIRMGFFVGFDDCLITDWGAKTDWELIVNSGRSLWRWYNVYTLHILWAAAIAVYCFCQISSGLRSCVLRVFKILHSLMLFSLFEIDTRIIGWLKFAIKDQGIPRDNSFIALTSLSNVNVKFVGTSSNAIQERNLGFCRG